jgi:hypothetical protein
MASGAVYVIRQERRQTLLRLRRPKCGCEKPHKGRNPTAVFRSPIRPTSGEASVLLRSIFCFYSNFLSSSFSLILPP